MVVHADNLWKRFGRVEALQGLSVDVPKGSMFAFVGANGAGKSTAIKVLMNIIEPTIGTATVLGTNTRALSPRQLAQIGYVSEHQEMPKRMTVSAYIAYLRPFYPTWDGALEAEIVRQFRLPPDRRIGELSHGMRMKTALACALPFRPTLLVLDEPLSGLDPLVRDEFLDRLRHLIGETTVLISSHELAEIETVATHVAFLNRGRIVFQDTLRDLTARVRHVRVTLQADAVVPTPIPKGWLDVRAEGHVLSFIDTSFNEHDLSARVAAAIGSVHRIEVQPMALRTIYTALARAERDGRSD
jgi:ABC-2 type transport system ATP-binding protein